MMFPLQKKDKVEKDNNTKNESEDVVWKGIILKIFFLGWHEIWRNFPETLC